MRKLFWVSVAGAAVNAALLVVALLSHGPAIAFAPAAFAIAFACLALTLYQANDRKLGRIRLDRIWALLLELPAAARAGLAVLLMALLAVMLSGVGNSDVGFFRVYVAIAVWVCVGSAALAYGVQAQRERGRPLEPSCRSTILFRSVYIALGLAAAGTFFVLNRNPVNDEQATHDQLTAQFSGASWYPHLVAANTYHSGFAVYLDTRDPSVQAAACTDLLPEAAKLGRKPALYFASGRHGTFDHLCGS